MWVLGIESSCDETAAAVLEPSGAVRASVVHSQEALHARYGGVVPELASREHLEKIYPVVDAALKEAGVPLSSIEGIAVTHGPGLIGSLLVGVSFAKSLALVHRLPLVGINHLEGHLVAPFIEQPPPTFPLVALLVSGGHTSLYLARDLGVYECLGATRDDAAGEAFDKVAKLMGLGYPGGAQIDRLARSGDPAAIAFPRGMQRQGGFDFSFSGLKTAVLNHLQSGRPTRPEDLAASFQEAVVDVLARKTLQAARRHRVEHIVVSGGVAANSALRARFERDCAGAGISLHVPSRSFCTDNAAMIAWAGQQRLMRGQRDPLDLSVEARLRL
jgi:N6-L-threonylcarbamoyladenine synthase